VTLLPGETDNGSLQNMFFMSPDEPFSQKAKIVKVGRIFVDAYDRTWITDWWFDFSESPSTEHTDIVVTALDTSNDNIQVGGYTLNELREIMRIRQC
jgi:hypothetical protein